MLYSTLFPVPKVTVASGACLVVVGGMIYADSLTRLTSFLERNGIGWYLGQ